jgi:phospholipid/cholesterol/gamma-HCH transport system substrate-binding protein
MRSSRLIGVGVFVIGGLLLFAAGLFLIGDRRGLFRNNFEVYAEFARLAGLENGATVRVAGLDAGEVKSISVPTSPSGRFRVRMQVREDLHGVVRTDSVASIQTEGLVGNKFVQVEGGSAHAPRAPDESTIQSREPFDIADLLDQLRDTLALVNETVTDLKVDVQQAIATIADTAGEARDLIASSQDDVAAIMRNGQRVTADMRVLMDDIAAGKGTVGRLLHDDALYRDAQRIVNQAQQVVANLQQVTEQARQAVTEFTGRIKGQDSEARGLAADLRQTIAHARDAMADLADDAEALKRNFLFRGFFNRRGYFDIDDLSPEEYRTGALAGKDRKGLRIWLEASNVFEKDTRGAEQLTASGRERLNSAMSQFLKYPPSAPLVIEGYADEPTADERYIVAQRRAALVREYVVSRFNLDGNRVGIIVLGNEPPQAAEPPSGMPMRGVALTLFVPR